MKHMVLQGCSEGRQYGQNLAAALLIQLMVGPLIQFIKLSKEGGADWKLNHPSKSLQFFSYVIIIPEAESNFVSFLCFLEWMLPCWTHAQDFIVSKLVKTK